MGTWWEKEKGEEGRKEKVGVERREGERREGGGQVGKEEREEERERGGGEGLQVNK